MNPSARQQPPVIVTTSWDDGHVLDHRLAALLDRYDLEATFYIAPRNVELSPSDRLTAAGTGELAARFEIGGHTLNHLRLTTLPDDQARREVISGKEALEDVIGKPVESFCYPCGAYNATHPPMVEQAGFSSARTVRRWVTGSSAPFEMATAVNAYRHLVDALPVLRLGHGRPRHALQFFWNWDALAIALFDQVLVSGGIFHLWGHSWEIDGNGDWERLERVLAHISHRDQVVYLDNAAAAFAAQARAY